jgi:hypothetical protein
MLSRCKSFPEAGITSHYYLIVVLCFDLDDLTLFLELSSLAGEAWDLELRLQMHNTSTENPLLSQRTTECISGSD